MVLVLGVGRCAFRPPRVVFVLGLVSLINSVTSGKKKKKKEEKKENAPPELRVVGLHPPPGRNKENAPPGSASSACVPRTRRSFG